MEKDQALRYQSAAELRADLQRLARDAEQEQARKKVRRSVLAAGGAAAVFAFLLLVMNPGGLRDRLVGRPSAPPPDPKRVVVTPFENGTGDPSLDNLGRMAAEWVSEELLHINSLQIVPSSTVFKLAGTGTKAGRAKDPGARVGGGHLVRAGRLRGLLSAGPDTTGSGNHHG